MEQLILQQEAENNVLLRGILVDPPEFSHENHGKRFDKFRLSVQRLSGAYDHLDVLAEHGIAERMNPSDGPFLEVAGQIRSFNNHSGQGSRLVISVYAQTMFFTDGEPENLVTLCGNICKDPIYRHTPLGREICDVMLAVERKYRRRDYVPCILWGSVARMAAQCQRGQMMKLQGRLQSRDYTKQTDDGPQQRRAFEVSAIHAEVMDQPRMD